MLSLAPATTTSGLAASIATAGSFCLFWEKMLSLLPTVTSVSAAATTGPAARTTTSTANSAAGATRRPCRIDAPPLGAVSKVGGYGDKESRHPEDRTCPSSISLRPEQL